ncbi:MAG: TetR family transcriptional regulator C-terminal domain-containing protein [Natronohydrobacter sp.]|nr:TetR family transcriptional regulator C-terminal domain-containing protein [Natronohydrobacter sp.]
MSRVDLAEKRDEILQTIRDAAIAEFAAHGFSGASTQGIAARAAITKNRLHYYITSKDDLYADALRYIVALWDEMFHGIDMTQGPEPFLREYISRKLHHVLAHPEIARMFTAEIMRGAPVLQGLWQPAREATLRAAQVVEGWVEAGLIRPIDPILLQMHIWALTQHHALHSVETVFMLGLSNEAELDPDRLTEEIVALVLNGLRPQ